MLWNGFWYHFLLLISEIGKATEEIFLEKQEIKDFFSLDVHLILLVDISNISLALWKYETYFNLKVNNNIFKLLQFWRNCMHLCLQANSLFWCSDVTMGMFWMSLFCFLLRRISVLIHFHFFILLVNRNFRHYANPWLLQNMME